MKYDGNTGLITPCCPSSDKAITIGLYEAWGCRFVTGGKVLMAKLKNSSIDVLFCPFCGKKTEFV